MQKECTACSDKQRARQLSGRHGTLPVADNAPRLEHFQWGAQDVEVFERTACQQDEIGTHASRDSSDLGQAEQTGIAAGGHGDDLGLGDARSHVGVELVNERVKAVLEGTP